jgi:hypothetical protein
VRPETELPAGEAGVFLGVENTDEGVGFAEVQKNQQMRLEKELSDRINWLQMAP